MAWAQQSQSQTITKMMLLSLLVMSDTGGYKFGTFALHTKIQSPNIYLQGLLSS